MKTIPGFPDYAITTDGRVWSKPRKDTLGHNLKGKWLRPKISVYGYCEVILTVNFQKYTCRIHRLVLETYVGPCPSGVQCRHLNGNSADNRIENLRWGTRKENMRDRDLHGRTVRGESSGASKLTEDKVRAIRYLRKTAKFSLSVLAWRFDIGITAIWDICTRRTWRHI